MPRLKIFNAASGEWEFAGGGDTKPYVGPEPPVVISDGKLWWDTDDNSILPVTVDPNILAVDPAFSSRYAPTPRMGSKIITVDQGAISSVADLVNFTITFTVIAGHAYEVAWLMQLLQVTSGAAAQYLKLADSAVDLGYIHYRSPVAAGDSYVVSGQREVVGLSAGVHTLKLVGATSTGTMNVTNAGVNGRYTVRDLGV